MKFLSLVMIVIIGCLSYDLWFGHNGIAQYRTVSVQVKEARLKAEKLTLRNQAVQDEIADLNQDMLTVEELARDELGMIKPGETFYRVIEPVPATVSKR
ncbi:MAG TPA: cell division protein FtsB [Succinivibrionaceae bacterium]|nr:cell division protein FtsB [Succinivibrionaceae bacterium]